MSDIERPVRQVERRSQLSMFDEPVPDEAERLAERNDSGFIDPDPTDLFFGNMRLRAFLEQMQLGWVVGFRQLIRSLDFSAFEEAYSLQGRPPYAPASMVGLILYGLMTGRQSLRELEVMARSDLGAMWISGGIFPDHSVLGRFLVRHQEVLSEALFEQVTAKIVEDCQLNVQILSGDGTRIEAASSRFQTVKLEAAQAYADKLRERHDKACHTDDSDDNEQDGGAGDTALKARLKKVEELIESGRERAKKQGRSEAQAANLRVVITEPEAAFLKHKRGRYAPGYTPSIIASQDRVIVAMGVDATNELSVVEPMVEQAERVTGEAVHTLLLDSNYHRHGIAEMAVEQDIDLLSPSQSQASQLNKRSRKTTRAKASGGETSPAKFDKTDFQHIADKDVLVCPAGESMKAGKMQTDVETGRRYKTYYAPKAACQSCHLREQCTTSKRGRRVKRYEGEELLEVLREVMEHRAARARYARRFGAVEPVFSELKERLGLNRFGRFGLNGAKLELALSAMAYNLRRWVKLGGEKLHNGFQAFFFVLLSCWQTVVTSRLRCLAIKRIDSRRTSHLFWHSNLAA